MKRTVRKEIKLNRDEWERICDNAQKSKKKIGTYIREAAVCGSIKIYDLDFFKYAVMSFNRTSGVLNEIAKVANSTGEVCRKDVEDMRRELNYLEIFIEQSLPPPGRQHLLFVRSVYCQAFF